MEIKECRPPAIPREGKAERNDGAGGKNGVETSEGGEHEKRA
jgi:hypothetical protein